VIAWSKPRSLNLLLDIARRIAVRVGLAEADYEAAYQAAIAISSPGEFPPHNVDVGEDMLDLVTAAVLSGHTEEAAAHVAEAHRLRIGDYSPRVAALMLAVSAMTARDTDADALYRSALNHPDIAEFPFDHARIALAQGMWQRRSRRPAESMTTLELAAQAFELLGARPWAERARAELRAAAAPVNQSPSEPTTITAQERRVAVLAAQGQTTKQIAERLSLSPRTIEAHLSRVFRKLGITRRGALSTALLHRDSELRPRGDDFVEIKGA